MLSRAPGEAQLFKDMSFIPGNVDSFVDALLGENNIRANIATQKMMVERAIHRSAPMIGLRSSNHMMADPDEVGERLRANRTQ